MHLGKSLVTALALCAAQSVVAAGEKPQVEFHALAPQASAKDLRSTTLKVKPSPVHTKMVATLRADGSVEMRCTEHHNHALERLPTTERVQ